MANPKTKVKLVDIVAYDLPTYSKVEWELNKLAFSPTKPKKEKSESKGQKLSSKPAQKKAPESDDDSDGDPAPSKQK